MYSDKFDIIDKVDDSQAGPSNYLCYDKINKLYCIYQAMDEYDEITKTKNTKKINVEEEKVIETSFKLFSKLKTKKFNIYYTNDEDEEYYMSCTVARTPEDLIASYENRSKNLIDMFKNTLKKYKT
jgi:hypothetical protein